MPDEINADIAYCLARALVLAILVSSEGLLAKRRRIGFEQHLLLFSASGIFLASQLYMVVLSLVVHTQRALPPVTVWVWYPILSTIGLLGFGFAFDYARSTEHLEIRKHAKGYLVLTCFLLSLGALLATLPMPYRSGAPTSYEQLGNVAVLLHGAQAAAILLLAWKAAFSVGVWLSVTESRVFLFGCFAGLLGVSMQVLRGPREHFTTLALTLFVAVILRDNYRRSQHEAVRASEDRAARMLLFHRVTTQLKSSFDLSRLYEILMDSLLSNLGAQSGAVYLRRGATTTLQPVYVHGPFPPPVPLPGPYPSDAKALEGVIRKTEVTQGVGVVGRVAESGTPLYIYDENDVGRHYKWDTAVVRVRTAIALPLRSPEGIYGVIQVVNRLDGASFSEEDIRFMSLLVEQAGLAIYNARLHAERIERQRTREQFKIARDIQLHLVPTSLPHIAGISIGAEYNAAQEVGGDYYDIYQIDHDHVGLVVFDVAGKGVPGALLMAITATFLKMAAPRATSPAWVLNEVNAALSTEIHRGLYVTAMYVVLEISTGKLTVCNAGHPDGLLIRADSGACEAVNPRGAALGLLRPNRFRATLEAQTRRMQPGDTLLLYTDGIIEARDPEGNEFGQERLTRVACSNASKGPSRLAAELLAAVQQHAGSAPQYDDTTVLALQLMPESDSQEPQ